MNQEIAATAASAGNGVHDFSVLLSSTPRGARLARLLATDQLRAWGLPCEAAAQVVAELAANAAAHGRLPGRSFRLTLYVIGRTLRIEVADTRGDRRPELREPDPYAESGRGLVLVDALADRWGVADGRFPRKTVWAELGFAAPVPAPTGSGGEGPDPGSCPGRVVRDS
ncbi:ATP-binding protein [Streptomyces sp. NBC_00820]|uniref:ATP-binding protein n=1 Tax=Streptomyces sp. NBC_00820 TaxID=2975842 RepID=UPI002ED1FA89|nr:ATP-binding protein [Streptomyces sp. NBC_00820]